jgi:hypothetical protein
MLAVNRCLELMLPAHRMETLFGGWRTWVLMALPIGYGLAIFLFDRAVLIFNGHYFAWFFDPHTGYNVSLSSDLV